MESAVALDLDERFDARQHVVTDPADAAILIEGAIGVAGDGAVGEQGILIDGTVESGARRNIQPVELLIDPTVEPNVV